MNRIEQAIDAIASVLIGRAPTHEHVSTGRRHSFRRLPLDTSHSARLRRKIQWIADRYRWQVAIDNFLDTKCAAALEYLTEPQLEDLLLRMEGYLDAAQHGCDMPDDLPAR